MTNKGKITSEETKKKQSEAHKGSKNPFYGKHHTNESKKKMSKARKGKGSYFYGKHIPEETKRKIGDANRGSKNGQYGKRLSVGERIKRSKSRRGKNAANWQGGITPFNLLIRNSLNYTIWRKSIFMRDNFTCQKCGQYGGKLRAHHINNFADFPELRLSIDNGIVLCYDCHRKFHKIYGKKYNTKEQLESFMGAGK